MADNDQDVHVDPANLISSELEALIQTDPRKGLTQLEADERMLNFGANEIKQVK